MRLKFYAQSAFHITADDGTRIMIDPYEYNERIRYDPTFDEADIVLVTHEHGDHANVDAVPGDYRVVRGLGTQAVRGMPFLGIGSYHDNEEGARRGPNTIFVFEVDGIRIAHFGDQGCELEPTQVALLSGVNVMLAPIGGGSTLDPKLMWALAEQVQPNIFVPCHFKTSEIDMPFITVDEFVEGKDSVRHLGDSEVTLSADSLPDPIEILVLDRSR
jgi:L-ascorbate metabolism protein UlaG (beta-lactamase superfamily)